MYGGGICMNLADYYKAVTVFQTRCHIEQKNVIL